jgi:2,3-diketo-5-methylthio-1-phosphopentane phosphatase
VTWQILVDFDGTITHDDTTDRLLERFADPAWLDIEAEWIAGRIGSRECMARQIDLVRATPSELEAFIDQIDIDDEFNSFVQHCRRNALPLTIVSDGLDRVIHSVLRRFGLQHLPVVANRLSWIGSDRWRLSSPNGQMACPSQSGTCKCAVGRRNKQLLTLVIGDGRSDRCVAKEADFVLAKGSLAQFCSDEAIAHRAFENFGQATSMLSALIDAKTPAYERLNRLEESLNG